MPVIKTMIISIVGVLTIGLSGMGVNIAFGQTVKLVIDGQSTDLTVVYGSVGEVLTSQHVEITFRDQVKPDPRTVVHSGTVIEVTYARPVDLTLNGQNGVYWTYATTVKEVLNRLGLGEASVKMSLPLDTYIPREGVPLTVDIGYNVTVTADGATQDLHSYGTVGNALTGIGLTWGDDDIITPAANTELADGLAITLVRVTEQTITRETPIPFEIDNSADPATPLGKVSVITKGQDGALSQTVSQILHDGTVVSETVLSETVVREPVTQVQKTGSKQPAVSVNVTPGSAQAIAYDMVIARGWDDSEFQCLVNLWNRESGWRVNASNPSGAYGIPQALPGSKMASAGADWQTNPATQIKWGLGYITDRYGTPCGAWGSFQAKGWY